jgi:hypothetical protein
MTDWLKIAQRELLPPQGDVSAVSTVPKIKNSENFLLSPEENSGSHSPTTGNAPIQGKAEAKNFQALLSEGCENGENPPEGELPQFSRPSNVSSLKFSCSGDQKTPPVEPRRSDAKAPAASLDEALRKPRELLSEEEASKNKNTLDEALRKPRELLSNVEIGPSQSVIAAPRWRRALEDKTIVVQRARNLPQLETEREAFRQLLTEYLDSTHPNTDPMRCAHCGRSETPAETLLPIGWGARHTWLHSSCHEAWRKARRASAIAELAAMGLIEPAPDWAAIYRERLKLFGDDGLKEEVALRCFDFTVNFCRQRTGMGVDQAREMVSAAINN